MISAITNGQSTAKAPSTGLESFWQRSEDWHTAGEHFRIVDGLPPGSLVEGLSVAEQRLHILQTPNHPLDTLRRALSHEPRGHADMYGGFITPPNDSGAHFGVLFWHREGFSTACGHGTIALGYWAASRGIVQPVDNGCVDVVIDVPSGRVVAQVCYENEKVVHVDFVNVASYQISKDMPVTVALESGTTSLNMDMSYGGAVYAFVESADVGLTVEPRNWRHFIDLQRRIKEQMSDFRHLGQYDLYGVCFFEAINENTKWVKQKNVVVFADGQIDRSPCGSGTSARLAILLAQGKVGMSKRLIHESIIGTSFEGMVESITNGASSFPACVSRIRGSAHLVGHMNFHIDPSDPLYPGFLFS